MKVQEFTGGLATKLRPQYLKLTEGAVYTNIDNTKGSLLPLVSPLPTDITVDKYNYFFEQFNSWVGRTRVSDFVEFQDDLYITDRISRMRRFDGASEYNVGIDIPLKITDFTKIEHPEAPTVTTFEVNTSVDTAALPEEDTYYALFNVDSASRFSNGMIIKVDAAGVASTFSANTTDLPYPTNVNFNPSGDTRDITISEVTGINYGLLGVQVYRLYKGDYRLVATLVDENDSFLDDTYVTAGAVISEEALGVLTGIIQYSMAFYNSLTGVESGLSTPSDEIEFDESGSVQFNSLQSSTQAQVDKKRLYRIGGGLTSFSLVAELDNNLSTYTDAIPNFRIEADIATTENNNVPLDGSKYLTEHNAMLFAVVGNRLYFTPVGEPENWPRLNFIQYSLNLTGIATTANGLLVFNKNRTFIVTGNEPAELNSQPLDGTQGCISHDSVQAVGGSSIWASLDGLCTSNGSFVKLISRERLGKVALTPVGSAVHDEVYYCLNTDNTILAFDYGNNGIFKTIVTDLESLSVANDNLYGWKQGKLQQFFAGTSFMAMQYTSPRFIEGRVTELKTYKKVYTYSKGLVTLKVIIDDEEVLTKEFDEEGAFTTQIPQDKQRGCFIQFIVEGTGELYELEYIAGVRAND